MTVRNLFPRDHKLYAIVVLAFVLRLWGVWNVTTTDEYNEVFEALRVCSGHLNLERWGKRFYLYILSVEYGIFYAIGWVFGQFQNPLHFAEKVVRDLEPLLMIGRLTSVVAGTLTVAVIYQTGKRFFNDHVAVIAALLLSVTAFHIDLSQQAKVDALLGLLVSLSLYYALKIMEADRLQSKDYALCGLFAALAIQTKMSALPLLITVAVALYFSHAVWRSHAKRSVLVLVLCFLIGTILGNPAILLSPLSMFQYMFSMTRQVYTEPVNVVPVETIGYVAYPIYLYQSLGAFNLLLMVCSLVYSYHWAQKGRSILFLSFVTVYYLLVGASINLVSPYYLIPLLPFITLMMADCIVGILDRLKLKARDVRIERACALLVLVFMFIPPAWSVFNHGMSLAGENTRYVAKEWIEANIPPGSKVLMDSGRSFNSSAPPIAENRASIERMLDYAKDNISKGKILQAIVDKNALVYYELLLKTVPEKSYDITSTLFGLHVETVDYYIANGYQYFIISQERKDNRTGEYARKNMPEIADFYESLDTDERIRLLRTISPTAINRGDTFLIYKLQS